MRPVSLGALTVAQAVDAYVDDLRARKGDRAARAVKGRLRRHLIPVLGEHRVAHLTAGDLTAWRNSRVSTDADEEKARRSRDTANRLLGMAKACLNLAFNNGLVPDDQAWRKVKRFRGVGAARMVLMTDGDLQALFDCALSDLQELISHGARTGCRWGEMRDGKVRDFDPGVRGKTGRRTIHLSSASAAQLRRLTAGKKPEDFMFLTVSGAPWTPTGHTRPFARAVRAAGIDPRTVPYSLRHTWISRALAAGIPTQAVAEHAGTSVGMIERYYGKFFPAARQQYAELAAPVLRIASSVSDV